MSGRRVRRRDRTRGSGGVTPEVGSRRTPGKHTGSTCVRGPNRGRQEDVY